MPPVNVILLLLGTIAACMVLLRGVGMWSLLYVVAVVGIYSWGTGHETVWPAVRLSYIIYLSGAVLMHIRGRWQILGPH